MNRLHICLGEDGRAVPIGVLRIRREGKNYVITIPRDVAVKLLSLGIQRVPVYFLLPEKGLEAVTQ